MTEKVTIGNCELWHGDCREVLPLLPPVDVFVTDPPYPNEYAVEYGYEDGVLEGLGIKRGLIFWTSRRKFPLEHSSLHVWDKKISVGRDFELIYEVGGNGQSVVFRHYLINSTVAASMCGDVFNEHPSQKPLRLMLDVVGRTKGGVCDPFMGSGTTGVACAQLGRVFYGVERERKYFDLACERIDRALAQPRLFEDAKVGAGDTAVQGDMLLPANAEIRGGEAVPLD